MKISYNWLKDYINIDIEPKEVANILTFIGLEVTKIEKYQSIPGGLEGLVVGKVLTCEKHPRADKLSVTTVDIGGKVLPIVCGAPNVAAGQKVIVAPVGITIYPTEGEPVVMKKVKIRGEVSEGMIVAEDEVGLGSEHDGIIVLPDEAQVGKPAKEYFDIYEDWIFEIDLTPNRQDAMSHYGVARDIYAYLKTNSDIDVKLNLPNVDDFTIDSTDYTIPVEVKNTEACPRYSALTFRDLEVKQSPKWLQERLKAIGQKPINNVVDITNYILHEIGQPMHAFDSDKIKGNKVIVDTVPDGTPFTLLDGREIKLTDKDLMICDAEHTPMCIGGVMGGLNTGVTEQTKNVFLESAFFNPTWIRKTAKRHQISTDASYRFERGTDINITIWALKRAAQLLKKYANAKVTSSIVDVYPNPIDAYDVVLRYEQLDKIIGKKIDRCTVKRILEDLEITIINERDDKLFLKVPTYRYDVRREADIIEEIIRIYGYNNITEEELKIRILNQPQNIANEYRFKISQYLASRGFNEIMTLSITKDDYYKKLKSFDFQSIVRIHNPLSNELTIMRQTLLFGELEAVSLNIKRQNADLKFFELGKVYFKVGQNGSVDDKYKEIQKISLLTTGLIYEPNWRIKPKLSDIFYLKSEIEALLEFLGFDIDEFAIEQIQNDLFNYGLEYKLNNKTLVYFGAVAYDILKSMDIEQDVFYAEIDFDLLLKYIPPKPQFVELARFPKVRRDLSLLIDKSVRFADIKKVVYNTDRRLIKRINIFDVYQSDKLPPNTKSYAISIIIQDETKTLTDKQIDKLVKKVIYNLEKKLQARIRS